MNLSPTYCTFHPDRRAGVACQRCGRPICPDCMVPASVGFQCPECVRRSRQQVYDRARIERETEPIVTKALIAVNALVFILTAFTGGGLGRSSGELYRNGMLVGASLSDGRLIGVDFGQWYRVITGGFLHANLLHIGFNMYLLYLLGSALEPALGRWRFTLLYSASLLAGSAGVLLLNPLAPTVGASGAVFGLMGAMLVAQRAVGIKPWESSIAGLVLINLLLTFAMPSISIGGHVGGLIGGVIAGVILVDLPVRLKQVNSTLMTRIPEVLVVIYGAAMIAVSIWAAAQWPSHI